MCFGWFCVVRRCFDLFLVSCFNLCLVVSNIFHVVSGFQFLLTCLKIAVVCSRLFYVFSEVS